MLTLNLSTAQCLCSMIYRTPPERLPYFWYRYWTHYVFPMIYLIYSNYFELATSPTNVMTQSYVVYILINPSVVGYQLPMQSVPISLSPLILWVRITIRARHTTLCDKVCQWLETGRWFSPGTPASSTNKTDLHDITEILLKMALSAINPYSIII